MQKPDKKKTFKMEHMCRKYTETYNHNHITTILWPFFRDHPGEPVPEENFWTLWCNGRLTEAWQTH